MNSHMHSRPGASSWGSRRPRSAAIVVEASGRALLQTVAQRCPDWLAIAGVVELDATSRPGDVEACVRGGDADLVLVCGSAELLGTEAIVALQARGVSVWYLADVTRQASGLRGMRYLAGLPWQPVPRLFLSRRQLAAKKIFDLSLVLLAAPAVLVLALVLSALVKLTSPGPVLYRQTRVGRGGRPFLIVKFRTMADEAESACGPALAHPGDPRLTALGRRLKNLGLDELPQLWNVLRGDMSLVGPRPERPVFVERFMEHIPAYGHRHVLPPGLTGLAQTTGDYTSPAAEKLRCDLLYAAHWSPWTDMRLLARTFLGLSARACTPELAVAHPELESSAAAFPRVAEVQDAA